MSAFGGILITQMIPSRHPASRAMPLRAATKTSEKTSTISGVVCPRSRQRRSSGAKQRKIIPASAALHQLSGPKNLPTLASSTPKVATKLTTWSHQKNFHACS